MISEIIAKTLNFKNGIISVSALGSKELSVTYRMSIPNFIDDSTLIKESCHSIIYSKNRKKGTKQYVVDLTNISEGYPMVGRNKYFCYNKKYNIIDCLDKSNFTQFLNEERIKIFTETKANILLQKIGVLSKHYEGVTSGSYYSDSLREIDYGRSRYDVDQENKINGIKTENIEF